MPLVLSGLSGSHRARRVRVGEAEAADDRRQNVRCSALSDVLNPLEALASPVDTADRGSSLQCGRCRLGLSVGCVNIAEWE